MPESSPESGDATRAAHLPATIALAASGSLLAFLVLLAPLHALVPTVALPEPLLPHHQTAETLLYILAFFVLLPLAVWLAPRLIDLVLDGSNPGLTGPLAALTALAPAVILILVRLAGPDGELLWVSGCPRSPRCPGAWAYLAPCHR